MKVDNFAIIKNVLKFDSEDEFYFLQIIKRRKENPDMSCNSKCIRTYYIKSIEYLDAIEDEIKFICNKTNARAYINLNVRSFKNVTKMCLKEFTDRIINEDYTNPQYIFDKVVGQCSAAKNRKLWIVDVDNNDYLYVKNIWEKIEKEYEPINIEEPKVAAITKTINGYHILSKPFQLNKFKEDFPDIDVHKNNPTLLFY